MSKSPDSLDDLNSEQVRALVELAEAYRDSKISRRNILKSAGVGGLAGFISGAGWTWATNSNTEATSATKESDREPTIKPKAAGGSDIGSLVASPGNVQAALESAASNDRGKVVLDPSQRYEQPKTPFKIKENVILDFNGAILYGNGRSHNTDIIHIYPGGQVHHPRINLHDSGNGYDIANGYRGRVFTLDTQFGGSYFAHGTTIRNGHIAAAGDTGTACYLGVNRETSAISHMGLNLDIGLPRGLDAESSLGTALHLDTTGAGEDGYINGVWMKGHWRYVNTGVLQTGTVGRYNQQSRNTFRVQIQSGSNSDYVWQITDPTLSRLNTWWGNIWDQGAYDGVAWAIDSTYQDQQSSYRGCKRNAINSQNFNPENVRNRSPNTHFVTRVNSWKTTEV